MDGIAKFVGYAFLILIVIGLFSNSEDNGEDNSATALKNSCKIHTVDVVSDTFVVNEEFDAGYKVTTTVENKGATAQLVIVTKLTSSEGDFQRTQTVFFNENESKSLTYQFHEPSISATNINAIVSCQ
jgi:hypothetical protein